MSDIKTVEQRDLIDINSVQENLKLTSSLFDCIPELSDEFINLCKAINIAAHATQEELKSQNELLTLYGFNNLENVLKYLVELEEVQTSAIAKNLAIGTHVLKSAKLKNVSALYISDKLSDDQLSSSKFLALVACNLTKIKAKNQKGELEVINYELDTKNPQNSTKLEYTDKIGDSLAIAQSCQQNTIQNIAFVTKKISNKFSDHDAMYHLIKLNNKINEETKNKDTNTSAVITHYNHENKSLTYSNLGKSGIIQVVLNKDGNIDSDNTFSLTPQHTNDDPIREKMILKPRDEKELANPLYKPDHLSGAFGGGENKSSFVLSDPYFSKQNYQDLINEGKQIYVITTSNELVKEVDNSKIAGIASAYHKNEIKGIVQDNLSDILLNENKLKKNATVQVLNVNKADESFISAVFDGRNNSNQPDLGCSELAEKTTLEYISSNMTVDLPSKLPEIPKFKDDSINKKNDIDKLRYLFAISIDYNTREFSMDKFLKEYGISARNLSPKEKIEYENITKMLQANIVSADKCKKFTKVAVEFGCFCTALFIISGGAAMIPLLAKLVPEVAKVVAKNPKLFGHAASIAINTTAGLSALLGVSSFVGSKILSDKEQKELKNAINSTTKINAKISRS